MASVWTHAQFLEGSTIKGPALGLRIAAGNVPNFVDLANRRLRHNHPGRLKQHPDAHDGKLRHAVERAGWLRTTRVKAGRVRQLFRRRDAAGMATPTDTLAAALSIARNAGYKPERVFALLDAFYPVPQGKNMRATPFMPYLSFAPGAWVLPLKFSGGGNAGGAKVMFDSQGNAWSGANFIVGWQGHDDSVGRQLVEVRPERPAAFPDDHRVYRRWSAGPRVRDSDRCQRPRVGNQHQRPDDFALRQDRQAAVAARGLQLRRQARHDAGHHRHAQWRCLGARLRRRQGRVHAARATRAR